MVNIAEQLQKIPPIVNENGRGALHIPIVQLEHQLDIFRFSTRDYKWELYKDESGNMCVAASIVLSICVCYPMQEDNSSYPTVYERSFVGACNFSLLSIAPIPDWNATAKSMCIKNAATDIGTWLGRGLNAELIPERGVPQSASTVPKMSPDKKVRQQYDKAIRESNQTTIDILSNIYDFNA